MTTLAPSILSDLLRWGAANGRLYPWRETRGYPLAVAEILLQKTKAEDVLPVWRRIVELYPDPVALASVDKAVLFTTVAKLGLGRQRCSRLQAVARSYLGGECLPGACGLGTYGLAVVALTSDPERVEAPPVDGNIARIATRLNGFHFERGEPRKKPEVKGWMEGLLLALPPADRIRAIYAVVDLGATICLPRMPECGECPLLRSCRFAQRQADIAGPGTDIKT